MPRLLLLSIASLLAGAFVAPAARAAGLCRAAETTYFSCPTARHKTISLCGGPPATLQYRYGTVDKVELAFPQEAAGGARQLGYAHDARYQVDRSEVTFVRNGVGYAVFDGTDEGRRSAGVRVTTRDGTEHEMGCAGAIQGHLDALGPYLHCDPDNALNGGSCP